MKNKKSLTILVCAALLLALSAAALIYGAGNAGTASDPVVTKSYADSQIEKLEKEINVLEAQVNSLKLNEEITEIEAQVKALKARLKENETEAATAATASTNVFKVVEVAEGKTIYCGASCQLILRSGTATAIGSTNGGISDLTEGKDLTTGTSVQKNHLLLIPRDDGRGIKCITGAFVMICGEYSIK